MKEPKACILVVEDDPPILNGLLDFFVFNGFSVTGAATGPEGLEASLSGTFDLVILDVMLPGLDGFSICRDLRRAKPGQAIIMLTAKGSEDDVVTGFSAGADDYVSKPFSLRELMVRVEAVLRRAGKHLGHERMTIGDIFFDGPSLTASRGQETVELTRREMDILVYLHRNRDHIVSRKELLGEVWNYPDPEVETRTVDIHLLKLRRKLTLLSPEIQLIQTVRGSGYRLGPGSETV